MKKWLPFILLLLCTAAFCQERKMLPGKVVTANAGLSNIFVINKATGLEVKTDAEGAFTIPAKPGDKIAVYSPVITARDFAISEASFKEVPYVVEVDAKGIELDEVVVNNVNSHSLGLVPKGYVFPTANQRSIKFHGTVPHGLDYVLYALSGNLYYKKLEAKYAQKRAVIESINTLYSEDEIVEECGVPREYVNGFLFYAAENSELDTLLQLKNTGGAKLLLNELGLKYLEIISNE